MIKIHAFAMIALCAAMQPASAQQPDPSRLAALEYVGRTGWAGRSIDRLKNEILRAFRRLDYDGGGIGPEERRFQGMKLIAFHRGLQIMNYLRSDLDGDGIVQPDEWQRFIRAVARDDLIRRSGIDSLPSEDEIRKAVQEVENDMIRKFGDPDENGDGTFTYREILAGANATLPRPDDPRLRLQISSFFDRNGDGIVAEMEVVDAVLSVLEEMDVNDDGTVSRDEFDAFRAEIEESSRQLYALRNARAEAMGFGPHQPVPGLTFP